MEKPKTNLDEVLGKFNLFGPYHLRFIACVWFGFLTNSMYSTNYIFAVENVAYRCKDPTFENNTCGIVNGTKCSEWVYDNPNSFVSEFNLACHDWKRTLVGTVNSFGYMVGLLITGPMSDRFGRKPVLVITGVLGGVFGLARSFTYSYWLYIVLEFLDIALGNCCTSLYVLSLEIVAAKNRVMCNCICDIGHILGGFIFPLIAWGIPYWRYLLHAIYAPAAFFILFIFIIDESPRWLLSKGKGDEVVTLVKKIAKFNNVTLDEDSVRNLSCCVEESQTVGLGKLLKSTFRSKQLLKRCLICIVWWTTAIFVSYGMMVNSVFLQGNKHINFALLMIMEVPVEFLMAFILNRFNRRNPLICSFFLSSILCFCQPFLPLGLPWLSVFVYVLANMLNAFCFGITYIYTSELFPTYTRNSMQALCSSIGRTGAILATQTPLLIVYWSGLPSILFGGAGLIASLLTFLVPDVANDSLPDTVEEAEAVGKKNVVGIENFAMSSESVINRQN